jgi:YVTN family beta-propeller protein
MIFTANIGSDSISIFERTTGRDDWNQLVIPVGKNPEGFDVTPDGKELWAADGGDGHVSVIDLTTKKVVRTFDIHTKRSNRLKFTPDGNLALVSDLGTGDLVVLDGHTGAERKRINLGHSIAGILITPDGSRAYVAATSDNNVAIVTLKTLMVEGRIHAGKGPDGMAWVGAR